MHPVGAPRLSGLLHHPAKFVAVTFLALIGAGTVVLLLPFCTASGRTTTLMTTFFTATSAVCVTGLGVVDTATHWSGAGQVVILVLMQVGGLGIMTLTSLLIVMLRRSIGLRQRIAAATESGTMRIGEVRELLRAVLYTTLAVEAITAAILFVRFWFAHDNGVARAGSLAVFHAVSAFNNAGITLFSDNLVGLRGDPVVLVTFAAAIFVGALGFPTWLHLRTNPRRPRAWDLHTKLTVSTTVGLVVVGWIYTTVAEWTNPRTMGPMSTFQHLYNGFFYSISSRTAGFNTVDIAGLNEPTQLLTEVLMFIGGGSGSTAGGIKVTTFALLGFVMWAEVRGDPDVVIFERRVPQTVQRQALTVALFAVGGVVGSTMLLLWTSSLSRRDLLFESISALATTGLSSGITPALSTVSQLVVCALMFIGRIGPPTVAAALVLRDTSRLYRHPEERVLIG